MQVASWLQAKYKSVCSEGRRREVPRSSRGRRAVPLKTTRRHKTMEGGREGGAVTLHEEGRREAEVQRDSETIGMLTNLFKSGWRVLPSAEVRQRPHRVSRHGQPRGLGQEPERTRQKKEGSERIRPEVEMLISRKASSGTEAAHIKSGGRMVQLST